MIIRKPAKEDLPALSALWQEAFGDTPEDVENFYSTAFSFDRCLMAEEQKPVGGIYWIDARISGQKVAYLYAFAVAEECRGQGIGKTLLEKALETLKGEGCAAAILVPGEETLCAYYEKAGFVTFEKARAPETCAPGMTVQKVTSDVYFAQRQKLAPAIGWGEEAFSYLGRFCDLYAGEGWLLSVGRDGVQEFLGELQDLPHILYTLKIEPSREARPGAMVFCFVEMALPEAFGPIF